MTEVPFNPAVKDGRSTRGLAVPKSNWANTIDEPPFEAYAVTCGLTFTFGGLKITQPGRGREHRRPADPRPVCRGRAGGRAVLSQLSRRHGPGVGRGAGQAGGRRRRAVRSGQEHGDPGRPPERLVREKQSQANDAITPTATRSISRARPPSSCPRPRCAPRRRGPTARLTFVVGLRRGRRRRHQCARARQHQIADDRPADRGRQQGWRGRRSVGARVVAAAKPDGQTLFYAVGTNVIINPWVQKGMIDTLATLAPICQTTDYQYVLVVNPKVPVNTAAELVALAKKDPDKLTFSSSGVGGNNHLAGALFADAAGIKITHVPYKGTGRAGRRDQRRHHHELLLAAAGRRPGQGRQPQGAGGDRREAHQVDARRADAQGTGHRRGGERLARPVRARQDARRHPRQDRRRHARPR